MALILGAMITYPMYAMIVYSFCTDNLKPIKYIIHMMCLRFQLGWLNMPGKEAGPNYSGRLAGKVMVQTLMIVSTIHLTVQIIKNNRIKAFIIIFNSILMYVMLIVASFEEWP